MSRVCLAAYAALALLLPWSHRCEALWPRDAPPEIAAHGHGEPAPPLPPCAACDWMRDASGPPLVRDASAPPLPPHVDPRAHPHPLLRSGSGATHLTRGPPHA